MENKTLISRACLYSFTILLLAELFSPSVLLAGLTLTTEPGKSRYPLGLYLEILEDKEKQWTIQEVTTGELDRRFEVNRRNTINQGYTDSAYWIRFKLKNSAGEVNWILEYGKPHMDSIELYLPSDSGGYTVRKVGDLLPFKEREVQSPNFLFPLNLVPQKDLTVYLRFETTGAMIVPLTLWTEEAFSNQDHNRQLAFGLYYGLIIVMIFYNLFLFLSLKDQSYLYYVLYISCVGLGISVSNGTSFEYLWPTLPWWQNHAIKFFYCLGNFFLILFTRNFLDTRRRIPHLDRLLFLFMTLALILLFFFFFISNQVFAYLMILQFAVIFLILYTSFVSLRKKHRPARFFFMAFSLMFIGLFITPFRLTGLIPETFITLYYVQIASAIETVLLSLALADRINILKIDRERAEEALQKSHNELEKKVNVRTIDYKKAKEDADRANRLKSEFLANISHELRNPMHHILSYSKYGVEKFKKVKNERLLYYFKSINKSGNQLMLLLNDLLDLSKLESGKMDYKFEKNDVLQITKDTIDELESVLNEKNLVLQVVDPQISIKVVCDFQKLRQVMRNVLFNALRFTPEGKKITISFEVGELPRDHKETARGTSPAISIIVKDEGIGIPEDELNFVFDKFIQSSRTKTGAGGTGLGLSICKEIINAHNGEIWAENNPQGGAMFSFMLPYEQNLN